MLTNQISQAATIILHGGVIAYSTETILGLGCNPHNRSACERLLWLKQRSVERGLILLVDDIDELTNLSQPLSATQCSTITSATTTPTTWLLPAKSSIPIWITGKHNKVAVRITRYPQVQQICKTTGAIVSTSANYSTYPPARNHSELRDWFGPHLDYIIIGPPGTGLPSEMRDLISGDIIRKGS